MDEHWGHSVLLNTSRFCQKHSSPYSHTPRYCILAVPARKIGLYISISRKYMEEHLGHSVLLNTSSSCYNNSSLYPHTPHFWTQNWTIPSWLFHHLANPAVYYVDKKLSSPCILTLVFLKEFSCFNKLDYYSIYKSSLMLYCFNIGWYGQV